MSILSPALKRNLSKNRIDIRDNFSKLLKKIEKRRTYQALTEAEKKSFRVKIFVLLNRANQANQKSNTSPFTALYAASQKGVEDLPSIFDIKKICGDEIFKSITGMQNGRGMPTQPQVEKAKKKYLNNS